MHRLRLRDEAGFSMVEMIVVVAILGIVLSGVTTVLLSGSHAQLQINNRFQAQEASRLALAAVRRDVHGACTAAVNVGKTQLTLSTPIGAGPTPTTQCGTVNAANVSKIIWCVLASSTPSQYALYRSTTSTCTSSSKLVADNLINTLTGFAGYFQTTTTTIAFGEFQTVDVDFAVSLKQGDAGAPFDLKERLALRNTVWSGTASTSCSAAVPCSPGPCDKVDVAGVPIPCYPPAIS
jgi:prepilin-type N-terminal cleavage/methylation domain-containing protein